MHQFADMLAISSQKVTECYLIFIDCFCCHHSLQPLTYYTNLGVLCKQCQCSLKLLALGRDDEQVAPSGATSLYSTL